METIVDLLQGSCSLFADKPALREKIDDVWQDLRYGELWRDVGRIAAGLQARGFTAGDRAALLAPASPRWVAAYLGILRAGGVAVPVDKELKAAELRHILSDSEASVLFTAEPWLEPVLELREELPRLKTVVLLETAPAPGTVEAAAATVERLFDDWHGLVESQQLPSTQTQAVERRFVELHRQLLALQQPGRKRRRLQEMRSHLAALRRTFRRGGELVSLAEFSDGAEAPVASRRPEDTAVILYTSGTTGRAKGAMLSHRNIVANIRATVRHFELDQNMTTLSFLPINHVFEQVVGVLLPLSLGGTVAFAESLKKVGENLQEVQPNFFLAVPALYRVFYERICKGLDDKPLARWLSRFPLTRKLVAAPIRRKLGGHTAFISGGAALDPEISRGLWRFGIPIYQGYGITETSPVIAAEAPGRTRPGTVGCCLDGVEVRIDRPNEAGEGEILVRGANVMQGYYNNPDATAEVLRDGWYHSGDLGRFDEEGFLHICGRVKNLIVTPNGKNVYPEEVEEELRKSPYIAEIMVYGHRVGPAAEEVYAIIFPDHEALDAHFRDQGREHWGQVEVEELLRQEILRHGKGLADYKRVKRFTLREDEFPKTTTRKIKRYVVEADVATENGGG